VVVVELKRLPPRSGGRGIFLAGPGSEREIFSTTSFPPPGGGGFGVLWPGRIRTAPRSWINRRPAGYFQAVVSKPSRAEGTVRRRIRDSGALERRPRKKKRETKETSSRGQACGARYRFRPRRDSRRQGSFPARERSAARFEGQRGFLLDVGPLLAGRGKDLRPPDSFERTIVVDRGTSEA